MRTTNFFIFFFLLFIYSILTLAVNAQEVDQEFASLSSRIDEVMKRARSNIWQEIQKDEPVWNFPPWLGTFFLSQYHFQLKALNISGDLKFQTKFDPNFLRNKLLKEQEPDGSWKQLVDLNQKSGSLDATIFNYWFLKDIGQSTDSDHMKKARKFILDHGGIQNAQMMTKYKLATFGVYQWVLLPYVPLIIFKDAFPFYSYGYIKGYVAQWVYPHLTGLAYLRYHKTVFPVSSVCLQQLKTSRSNHCEQYKSQNPGLSSFKNFTQDNSVDNLLQQIIKLRGRRGAFGAYTISTLLNLLSFKDYSIRYTHENHYDDYYDKNLQASLTFVEDMYFNRRVPYEGSLDDGRYWDTILAVYGLLQAGQEPQKLAQTIQYLIKTAVQPNGGIPYGHQFEYAPDIDDTAMLLMLYGKLKNAKVQTSKDISYQKQINRTYNWIKSNQNSDGGFPAFDRDKNDNQYTIIKLIFKLTRIDKSAQIFDPSCPDIVGHFLQAMGECGIIDDEVIGKSVKYLYDSRKDGMWSARWGINYVYAVGAVFPGLAKVGYSLDQQWLVNVTKRLIQVQQEDGGFGQTSQSYNQQKYVKGVTTVSMTSWGLLGLLQVGHLPIPNIKSSIKKAAKYILRNFQEYDNQFFDRSVVGTGHRGVLNLQYPVYAYSFPLVAISRLKRFIEGDYTPKFNIELTERINKMYGVNIKQKNDEL